MSRGGFQIERLREAGLDSPGVTPMPAVSTANGPANQVRRILALAGQTAHTVAAFNERASAEEDRLNVQNANMEFAKIEGLERESLSKLIETEVLGGNEAAAGDDGFIQGSVASRVEQIVGASDLNEAGRKALEFQLTRSLTAAAVSAREQTLGQIKADSIAEIKAGFASVTSPDDIAQQDEALANLGVAPRERKNSAVYALNVAARAADESTFGLLRDYVGPGTAEAKAATIAFNEAKRARQRETQQKNFEEAENAVSVAVDAGATSDALDFIDHAGIDGRDKEILRGRVESAMSRIETETRDKAVEQVYTAMYSETPEDAEALFNEYVEAGILGNADRGTVARASQAWISRKYDAEVAAIRTQVRRVNPNDPDAREILDDSMSRLNSIQSELDERNALATANPMAFGAVDPELTASTASKIVEYALEIDSQNVRLNRVTEGIASVLGGQAWSPSDIPLPNGKSFAGNEQREFVVDRMWQVIRQPAMNEARRVAEQTGAEPVEPPPTVHEYAAMVSQLELVPGAKSKAIEAEFVGIPELAFRAARENDPQSLQQFGRKMELFGQLYAINPNIAKAHASSFGGSDATGDLMEYFLAARQVIPASDTSSLAAAIGSLRAPAKIASVINSKETLELAEAAIKKAGLRDGNVPANLLADARNKIAVYHLGLGMPLEDARDRIAESLHNTYELRNGRVLRTFDQITGRQIEAGTLESVMRKWYADNAQEIEGFDPDELVLGQDEATGMWTLYAPDGSLVGPRLTGTRAAAIIDNASSYARSFREERGRFVSESKSNGSIGSIQEKIPAGLWWLKAAMMVPEKFETRGLRDRANNELNAWAKRTVAARRDDPWDVAAIKYGAEAAGVKETKLDAIEENWVGPFSQ